jgi:hypothetical protein
MINLQNVIMPGDIRISTFISKIHFHFHFHFHFPPNYLLIKLTDIAQTRRRRGRDAGSRTSSGTVGSSVAWHLHR